MQLWNFEGSFTPVDSTIGRPPIGLRGTRADNQPRWMKGCRVKLVRGLRRHESKPPAEAPDRKIIYLDGSKSRLASSRIGWGESRLIRWTPRLSMSNRRTSREK
jgi:hypothetical protein